MTPMIQSIATANPPRYITREEAFYALEELFDLQPAEHDLYESVLLNGPIKGRYIGMGQNEEAREKSPDALLKRFLHHGRHIASEAAQTALAQAHLTPEQLGGLVVNTCTGYLCPGLSSYVAEDLHFPVGAKVFDVMGMGCGAAIPNLECAAGILAREPLKPVLSIAVEICSATMFMGAEPDLIVSNSIFGDGAAAVVLTNSNSAPPGLCRLLDFETGLFPRYREDLRYRTEEGRLRNTLSKRVPVIGAKTVAEVAERLLQRRGLSQQDIRWWVVHPGGTTVLEQVGDRLGLPPQALRFSYSVFHDYGNMSSPTVLFVLKRILEEAKPRPGELGLLLAFGAGFTAFAALMEF